MHKRKIDKLASLYIVVSVFVAVLSIFSFTFAWYIKTSTQYLNIKFAPPVIVNINSETEMITPIDGNVDALLPGAKVGVNLGISMPQGSSNAYVRAKMSVVFDDVYEYDQNGKLVQVLWDSFVNVQNAVSENWVEVDFSRDPNKQDLWYVCKASLGESVVSREVSSGDVITFANGTISLSLDLDNRFAEKNINIVMVVESIQTEGVSDPLAAGVENAKYHEVWGSV